MIEELDLRFAAAVLVEVVSDLRGLPGPDFEEVVAEEGRGGLKGLGGIFERSGLVVEGLVGVEVLRRCWGFGGRVERDVVVDVEDGDASGRRDGGVVRVTYIDFK